MVQFKEYTREEVAKHNTEGDLWVIIDAKVFDLTKFVRLHPGGQGVLVDSDVAGQDATDVFFGLHRHEVLLKPQYARLQIGTIKGEEEQIKAPRPGQLSRMPYGEAPWLTPGFHSPYYKESHRKMQKAIREFFDRMVYDDAQARELDGKRVSQQILDEMTKMEMHAMRLGPGPHLKGRTLIGGSLNPKRCFDYFHELIITQELVRTGARGYGDGLQAGMVIGLPPVLNFGSEELKARIVPDILAGKKFISLAISEPFAGSDVGGLRTTAEPSEDKKYWIVNGTKKWITNGHFSDYFTVGCRTDGGFTVLLIERTEGVETKLIKTAYSTTAGTAYVTFDNVKVPVGNTLGEVDGGLLVMLSNFNHERWRMVAEECMKWASQRKVFGKPLLEQAVIRSKLAGMISRTEALQTWLEQITYQMCHMSYKQMSSSLAGPISFLKMTCTQSAQQTARDAVQIFGGRAITQTGMGRLIEHYHRTIAFDALLGGAEDVLGDLGVRQAIRKIPENVRL
ncbi:acyl-CoA dehydrogenase/oxidase [Cantharellus anzutake]|uniref:acyl-CoA dehydrogenase/oxidase n=1 Tax=Cantharellus anzutake TaxID=1750568 RepID=UPI001905ABC3|nr:acyl-CoA dehydrogenase/oxidase [Cantharellus anzutake]KAF8340591.1 acyl-CoA dehydrogenase/oxidase [Cantharellus anzutake]